MPAPPKNHTIPEREPEDAPAVCSHPDDAEHLKRAQLEAEVSSLRQTLRESRTALRRSATQSTQKLSAQANEISRLKALNTDTGKRLADLKSDHAIIELGRNKLNALTATATCSRSSIFQSRHSNNHFTLKLAGQPMRATRPKSTLGLKPE